MQFAQVNIRSKEIRKLVSNLETAGYEIRTTANQHIKVVNPKTGKSVFFGAQSLGDPRAGKNILRDLKLVGFNQNIKL